MRIKYLSPTSLKMFDSNRDEFYLTYVSDAKLPRMAQTLAMSVGSALDAYVKSFLYTKLFGPHKDYELRTLFEAQVEEHNRDEAWKFGAEIFKQYELSGMLASLLIELQNSLTPARLETTLDGVIDGVPIRGKPDLYFLTVNALRIIFDWKVNGFLSAGMTSPNKNYVLCSPGGSCHKNCFPNRVGSIVLDAGNTMDMTNVEWATQLSTYAWLLGEPVGGDFVCMIDQIVGRGAKMRIARFAARVDPKFQMELIAKYKDVWRRVESGEIFDLPPVENEQRKRELDSFASSMNTSNPDDLAYLQMVRNY